MSQMTRLLLNVNMKNVNNYYVSDDKTSSQCQQARKYSINSYHVSDDKTSPQCQQARKHSINNYYVSDDKTSPQCQHEECKQLLCLR
jgi:hypothetical protein